MNNCTFIGRISSDLELKTAGEKKVLNFSLAVDNRNKEKETDFIQIEVWGKQAENMVNNTCKGKRVGVMGELHIEKYIKNEQKHVKPYVVAEKIDILEWKDAK